MALSRQQVEVAFQSAYGRSATRTELEYWARTTKSFSQADLQKALGTNANRYVYDAATKKYVLKVAAAPPPPGTGTSDYSNPQTTADLDAASARIAAGTGSDEDRTNVAFATKNHNYVYTPAAAGPPAAGGVVAPKPKVKYKDTDAYKNLPKDLQEFVDISYNLIEVGGEDEALQFSNAITQAKAIADPYYKAQFDVALAEVKASIAEANQDYETKAEIYRRLRDEILADVTSGQENLTLDQQASLARLAKEYDKDLLDVADQAAEKGITFATGAQSRVLAEERTTQQYGDVVQSSGRTFNFKINELEAKAARGEVDAQAKLDALASGRTFDLQRIGRNAELTLGSSNLPTIQGFTPTGGVIGKYEEEKRKSMISDIGGFLDLQRGFLD